MICPLMSCHGMFQETTTEEGDKDITYFIDCKKEQCAWYNMDIVKCSINAIANRLYWINDNITKGDYL